MVVFIWIIHEYLVFVCVGFNTLFDSTWKISNIKLICTFSLLETLYENMPVIMTKFVLFATIFNKEDSLYRHILLPNPI